MPWSAFVSRLLRLQSESQNALGRYESESVDHPLIDELGDHEPSSYDYSAPKAGSSSGREQQLVRALSDTRAFKRLADIRFLGALDYCLVPHPNGYKSNSRYTRYQHSIGVASLAQAYVNSRRLPEQDGLLCIATAMLHDIGHAPFSHTVEPLFQSLFGINHHNTSEMIILGASYSTEVSDLLREFCIDPQDVVDVLNGNDPFDGFFSGPINFDTIEGILRSRSYLKLQNLGITPHGVLNAALFRKDDKAKSTVDTFWGYKDEAYSLVIRSRSGVVFDFLFSEALRVSSTLVSPADFLLTETEAFKKFPELRDAAQPKYWQNMIDVLFPEQLPYVTRRFYIEETGNFFDRADRVRYRQTKVNSILTRKDVLPA